MAVPPPSKQYLRRILRNQRDSYVSSLTLRECEAAAGRLAATVISVIADRSIVAAYHPIGSEIGTAALVERLHACGTKIALPHVTGRDGTPRFLAWAPGAPLIEGPFGLHQPDETAEELRPDLILTPLLGFDEALNRIGYGAGHYDRAFAANAPARRIGLAWAMQQCEYIPADPWDVPLHAVATEQGWIAR